MKHIIRKGIFDALMNNTPGLTVNGNVYFDHVPAGTEGAYIICNLQAGPMDIRTARDMINHAWNIRAVSTDPDEALIIAGQIYDLLHEKNNVLTFDGPWACDRVYMQTLITTPPILVSGIQFFQEGGIYRIEATSSIVNT